MTEIEKQNDVVEDIAWIIPDDKVDEVVFSTVKIDWPGDEILIDEDSLWKFMNESLKNFEKKMTNNRNTLVRKYFWWNLKYDQKKHEITSRWQSTKVEKFYKYWLKLQWLDINLTYEEWMRLSNFKNWVRCMQKTKRNNKKIIYQWWNINDSEDRYTFYVEYPVYFLPTRIIERDVLNRYCPICKCEWAYENWEKDRIMKKIKNRLNN